MRLGRLARLMSSRKILLFIVEGATDEESLGLILSRLINASQVRFRIVSCDCYIRCGVWATEYKRKSF